jgi:hypothetical protein
MAIEQVSKARVLEMMKRVGLSELAAEADRELPDPVDLKRDQALLVKYGMERDRLIDRMGGSP